MVCKKSEYGLISEGGRVYMPWRSRGHPHGSHGDTAASHRGDRNSMCRVARRRRELLLVLVRRRMRM